MSAVCEMKRTSEADGTEGENESDIESQPEDDKPRQDLPRRTTTKTNECICTVCKKRFQNQHCLSKHMIMHSNRYKCDRCEKCFRGYDKLNIHKRSHSIKTLFKYTVCNKCHKHFRNKHYLKKHLIVHSNRYKCSECGKCFRDSDKLKIHKRTHSGEKPFECSICNKQFSKSYALFQHKKIHNSSNSDDIKEQPHVDKPVRCMNTECDNGNCIVLKTECDENNKSLPFEVKKEADIESQENDGQPGEDVCTVHVIGTITEANQHVCTVCEKCFPNQHNLKKHMIMHSDKYKCSECGKCFRDSYKLKIHKRSHSGEKPFECSDCKKRFSKAHALFRHMKIHNKSDTGIEQSQAGEPVPDTCDKGNCVELKIEDDGTDTCLPFEVKYEADIDHQENDDELKHLCTKGAIGTMSERNQCVCTVCKKRFQDEFYLQKHMIVHSDKYKCTECGKCFRDSDKLKIHKRTHSGEKSFECSVCNKRFVKSSGLVQHRRIHTAEEMRKSMNLHSELVADSKNELADVTDECCSPELIRPIVVIRLDDLQDVKQEAFDEHEVKDPHDAVKQEHFGENNPQDIRVIPKVSFSCVLCWMLHIATVFLFNNL